MKFFITYLFLSITIISFSQDFLFELKSKEDFQALESIPLSYKFSNVGAVKVIYDIKTDQVYFSNSRYFQFHFDFCTSILDYNNDIPYFNEHNYKESIHRDYYLATLNHYRDADIYTFEFSTSDVLSKNNIKFYNKVKELIFCKEEIQLFPSTMNQQDFINNNFPNLNYYTADYIYKNLNFQVLNNTTSFGRLNYIDIDTFDTKYVHKNDIVVINGTPNEMPFCRGIITTEFQPPLSHIVILSHNRRTPIMALKTAWTDTSILKLDQKLVKFEVGESFYTIKPAKDRAADIYWNTRDIKRTRKLELDIITNGIQDINTISSKSVKLVGGKAANFGELNRIYINRTTKLDIPKASFAIPFYYYHQHIIENGIDTLIDNILDRELRKNPLMLEEKLNEIRNTIKKSNLNLSFLNEVKTKVKQNEIERLRFRSSTNAEDINGFNGAGLYDSKTGILNNNNKSIEKAIKKVWASLWNLRAFQEREFFKIDQETVAMGILVHQSFPDEEINGVCITKNIYRPEINGIVVNIQKGETSIVRPPSGVTSEQFIVKHNINSNEAIEIENVSYSSLNDNKALLSIKEIEKLNIIIFAVKMHFYSQLNTLTKPDFVDFALDIEFKMEKNTRKIIVKQARSY